MGVRSIVLVFLFLCDTKGILLIQSRYMECFRRESSGAAPLGVER